MIIIAAADRSCGIGKNGKLLYSLPGDMKFFRTTTAGNIVVMGRKTLESFPGGNPLKNRVNIVLTRNDAYEKDGVIVCNSPEDVLSEVKKYPDRQAFVIGGAEIYNLFLPYCNMAFITQIDAVSDADAHIADFDKLGGWSRTFTSETHEENGLKYNFVTYEKSCGE